MPRIVPFALVLAVALAIATVSRAQFVPPPENHFVTYGLVNCPPTPCYSYFYGPLELEDQFEVIQIDSAGVSLLANPASKNGEPMFDPEAHQTWWRIDHPTGRVRTVYLTHQFGAQKWFVFDPKYLVLPALKDQGPLPLPQRNHYLCYEATGPPLVPSVIDIVDQFGSWPHREVTVPRYFCNPVDKRHLDTGEEYLQVDPSVHLACYQITNGGSALYRVVGTEDQFHSGAYEPSSQGLFCLPCYKDRVVKVEKSTWGKIKALYKN
jgi:hypothetical protein